MPYTSNTIKKNGLTIIFDQGADKDFIKRITNLEHLKSAGHTANNLAPIYQDGSPVQK